MDYIARIYEILNNHLGETNDRGGRRLPEKYDPLKSEIAKLLSEVITESYKTGQSQEREKARKALGF